MKHDKIMILDCTLRDGGLGLEDSYINNISNIGFSDIDYQKTINNLVASNVDIVELGSIEITREEKKQFGIFQSIEEVSRMLPEKKNPKQMYVALFRGPDTPLDMIPDYNPSLVDGIRVIIRYSELKKSIEFCAFLAQKGYKVFVQPMLTMRYTNEELDYIISESNKMGAFACYFVDSYGYMTSFDVERLFNYYDSRLDKRIRIGFHAHNNMNLAYSNALYFLNIAKNKNRNIIIDSCVLGMGQGAGNLQTELIMPFISKIESKYNYEYILQTCETIECYLGNAFWGYSVTRLLPALTKTAYKYAIVFRSKYNLTYREIYSLLIFMDDSFRNRYTPDNARIIYEDWKKNR